MKKWNGAISFVIVIVMIAVGGGTYLIIKNHQYQGLATSTVLSMEIARDEVNVKKE